MTGHRVLMVAAACAVALLCAGQSVRIASALQPAPGSPEGIVVSGLGVASGPASAAAVTVLIGTDQFGAMSPSAMTEAELAPVIAVIASAGVAEDAIEVTNPATHSTFMGPGGLGSALVRFEIAEPTQSGMAELAQSLYDGASEADLGVQHISVSYLTDDCATLLQEATDAAVADGRVRAERLAQSLGVGLGALVQAAEYAYFDSSGQNSCAPAVPGFSGGFSVNFDQPFDATLPAEARVFVQVSLTFEMGAG